MGYVSFREGILCVVQCVCFFICSVTAIFFLVPKTTHINNSNKYVLQIALKVAFLKKKITLGDAQKNHLAAPFNQPPTSDVGPSHGEDRISLVLPVWHQSLCIVTFDAVFFLGGGSRRKECWKKETWIF